MAEFDVASNFLKKKKYSIKLAKVSSREREIDNVKCVIMVHVFFQKTHPFPFTLAILSIIIYLCFFKKFDATSNSAIIHHC